MSNPQRVQFWRSTEKLRSRTLGVLFFVVVALFLWTTVAIYNKQFVQTVKVDLVTDTAGNALTRNADVKVRGVTVGEVRGSEFDGKDVTLQLALNPDMADKIPANVTARLLPKTLFGERYIELVWPADPSAQHITAGMTLHQDASGDAVEVSQLLDRLLPLLQAVPPQYLASTLGAVSQALQGQGEELGKTIDRLDTIFTQVNTELPTLQEDLRSFAEVANTYADAAPQLVDALDNLRTLNTTIVQKRWDIDTLLAVLTPSSSDLADFLVANRDNIIDVAADSRPALEALANVLAGLQLRAGQLRADEAAHRRDLRHRHRSAGLARDRRDRESARPLRAQSGRAALVRSPWRHVHSGISADRGPGPVHQWLGQ